jgi:hypothetical protein
VASRGCAGYEEDVLQLLKPAAPTAKQLSPWQVRSLRALQLEVRLHAHVWMNGWMDMSGTRLSQKHEATPNCYVKYI